jgi:CO/xanthine dehydrogenase FAD-binding subunit
LREDRLPQFEYVAPTSVDEAIKALLSAPAAKVLAGGTDLIVQMRAGRASPGAVVDLKRIPGSIGIRREADGGFTIGAATSGATIGEDVALTRAWPGIVEAANLIGSTQVQGRASLGGNLCNASPAADGVPPLLILDAEVELASRRGTRRLALDAFISGARRTLLARDEVMTAVVAPLPASTMRSAFFKLGARRYLVISIVIVAVALDVVEGVVCDARIAVGACSAVAERMREAERRLIGAPARPGLGRAIEAQDLARLSPIDDVRATSDYRRAAALILLRRAIDACALGQAGGVV